MNVIGLKSKNFSVMFVWSHTSQWCVCVWYHWLVCCYVSYIQIHTHTLDSYFVNYLELYYVFFNAFGQSEFFFLSKLVLAQLYSLSHTYTHTQIETFFPHPKKSPLHFGSDDDDDGGGGFKVFFLFYFTLAEQT